MVLLFWGRCGIILIVDTPVNFLGYGSGNMFDEIEKSLQLPYKLIDIDNCGEHFIFAFKKYDESQDEYSIKLGGITGDFELTYKSLGLECQFECDITVGNVYDFYRELEYAYQASKNTEAKLKNYGNILNRTFLQFRFDKLGHCILIGNFKNKFTQYRNGVTFEIEIDQTYVAKILSSLKFFFEKLKSIQGHDTFY